MSSSQDVKKMLSSKRWLNCKFKTVITLPDIGDGFTFFICELYLKVLNKLINRNRNTEHTKRELENSDYF